MRCCDGMTCLPCGRQNNQYKRLSIYTFFNSFMFCFFLFNRILFHLACTIIQNSSLHLWMNLKIGGGILILMLLKVSHFRISSTCVFFFFLTSISIVLVNFFFIVVGFISLERICSILKGDILAIGQSSIDWITISRGVLINNFRFTIRAFKVWSLGGFIRNHL